MRPDRENQQPDHALTGERPTKATDRPNGGPNHPAEGTIANPIVVIGATGTIGRLVVGNLAASGRAVMAVAPQCDRLESLQAAHPPGVVTTLARRVLTERDAAELAAMLRSLARPIAGVVVALAVRPQRGRLLDRTADELRSCLDHTLLPHLAIARHLLPVLAESGRNGSYVMVGRPGSETPWAGYAHHSIAMAAVRMLAHALHEEGRALGVRVHLLSIDSPVRGEAPALHECPEWPTAAGIARRLVQLVERAATNEPARAIVTCSRNVSNSTTQPRRFPDVPALLKSLKTQSRHEVSRDDTP